jgi:hypothetical protein
MHDGHHRQASCRTPRATDGATGRFVCYIGHRFRRWEMQNTVRAGRPKKVAIPVLGSVYAMMKMVEFPQQKTRG